MASIDTWRVKLEKLGQSHLLTQCQPDSKEAIVQQLERVDANYPGGVEGYITNARRLLAASKNQEDSFAGYVPSQPPTFTIASGIEERTSSESEPQQAETTCCSPTITSSADSPGPMEEIFELESEARKQMHALGFVLVAGGLGERLGYPDIKVKLFTQVLEEMSYLEYYCKAIQRCQEIAGATEQSSVTLPFFIMTSGDTHARTMAFLEEHQYFGLKEEQVYVRQQEKVPALENSDARIAFNKDRTGFETKPHGHGDVHMILHQQGILKEFKAKYHTKWLFFFQDTNALAFRALHILLGVSLKHRLTMNSLAIPRLAGEAVGAICQLTKQAGENATEAAATSLTLNVEYNQLDSMLKSAGESGDVPVSAESKLSKYPGNCNILLFDMEQYCEALERSGGQVPEFVNPKYADASREAFKSPTRIECMMQEIPRMFKPHQIHGCTVLERWLCFSTVKNCCADASQKVTPECAYSAEQDLYLNFQRSLQLVHQHCHFAAPLSKTYNGVTYPQQVRCFISPEIAISFTDVQDALKLHHVGKIQVDHDSAFYLTPTHPGQSQVVPPFVALTSEDLADPNCPDNYKVRGYKPQTA